MISSQVSRVDTFLLDVMFEKIAIMEMDFFLGENLLVLNVICCMASVGYLVCI
jgi:hypothetical protein